MSVWGTVCRDLMLRGFSWKQGINPFAPVGAPHHASGLMAARICLGDPPTRLDQLFQQLADLAFSVPPSQSQKVQEY